MHTVIKGFLDAIGQSNHRFFFFFPPQPISMFVLEANTFQRCERNAKADRSNGWRMQKTKFFIKRYLQSLQMMILSCQVCIQKKRITYTL